MTSCVQLHPTCASVCLCSLAAFPLGFRLQVHSLALSSVQAQRAGPQHTHRYKLELWFCQAVQDLPHPDFEVAKCCHSLRSTSMHQTLIDVLTSAGGSLSVAHALSQTAQCISRSQRSALCSWSSASTRYACMLQCQGLKPHVTSLHSLPNSLKAQCKTNLCAGTTAKSCQSGSELHCVCPHCSPLWALHHQPPGDRVSSLLLSA